MSEPALASIRLNPFKSIQTFDKDLQVPWCKEGRILKERPSFVADPLFHAGTYYVQESSSMFLHFVLEQVFEGLRKEKNAGIKVLDLC